MSENLDLDSFDDLLDWNKDQEEAEKIINEIIDSWTVDNLPAQELAKEFKVNFLRDGF